MELDLLDTLPISTDKAVGTTDHKDNKTSSVAK
jgi:hypothetical protein